MNPKQEKFPMVKPFFKQVHKDSLFYCEMGFTKENAQFIYDASCNYAEAIDLLKQAHSWFSSKRLEGYYPVNINNDIEKFLERGAK